MFHVVKCYFTSASDTSRRQASQAIPVKYAINFISGNTFPMGQNISYGINGRASEARETLSAVYKFELMRYVYIYI